MTIRTLSDLKQHMEREKIVLLSIRAPGDKPITDADPRGKDYDKWQCATKTSPTLLDWKRGKPSDTFGAALSSCLGVPVDLSAPPPPPDDFELLV